MSRVLAAAPDSEIVIDDCWNRIGVRGNHSCPELVKHVHCRNVHCRNCPVHAKAASTLLDENLPDDHLKQRAEHFARPQPTDLQRTSSVLIFRLADEWLAVPTSVLVEVADPRPIHTLPHRGSALVLGLVNVRGELLVCVSLAALLGITGGTQAQRDAQPRRSGVYARLLVIETDSGRLVFPVDEVHGTHRMHVRELQEVPVTVAKAAATYSMGMLAWDGRCVGCLDHQLVSYALNRSLA
jgi:chemotaxis-related protein WspD